MHVENSAPEPDLYVDIDDFIQMLNTLYPGTRYHSVTIGCSNAAISDLLSTALFLLPEEEGRTLAADYDARVLYIP